MYKYDLNDKQRFESIQSFIQRRNREIEEERQRRNRRKENIQAAFVCTFYTTMLVISSFIE